MKSLTKSDTRKLINECISVLKSKYRITENRMVTLNGKSYPNFGWCIIFGGSGGSGKGHIIKNILMASGKVINVDHWKTYYAKMNGMNYDSHNAKQVSYIHDKISKRNWKKKVMSNIMNPQTHDKDRLPNIIIDMTAKSPYNDVFDIAEDAQELGYNTAFVWAVATRHESIIRNIERTRRIPDSVLHNAYNEIMINVPNFLQSNYAGECLDDAWIVFSSSLDIHKSDLDGDEKKTAAVRLQRGEKGFIIDKPTMDRLIEYLGEKEMNPDNPSTFLSSDEVISKYGTKTKDGEYKIDREKLGNEKKLYR